MDSAKIRFLIKVSTWRVKKDRISHIDPALEECEFIVIEIAVFYFGESPRDPATLPAHLTARD